VEEFSKGPVDTLLNPKSVPQGQRKRDVRRGKYKAKPSIGRGNYVKAPLLRDKVTHPRWQANALANNPHTAGALGSLGAAGVLHAKKQNLTGGKRKVADTAEGGLIGGAAGQLTHTQAGYGAKALAERQFKPLTTKGNYGPYKEGPHKAELNRFKREAQKMGGNDVRAKAKYFNDNFPKHIPSARARTALKVLDKKPVAASVIGGGALIGAGLGAHSKKVKKNMNDPFGVSKALKYSDSATKKDKVKHTAAGAGAMGLSATGGYVTGNRAAAAYGQRKAASSMYRAGAFKTAGKYRRAAHLNAREAGIGAGIAGLGIGAAYLNDAHGKKKGVLVKKNDSTSAFGIEH
jgi:hypothetical protein